MYRTVSYSLFNLTGCNLSCLHLWYIKHWNRIIDIKRVEGYCYTNIYCKYNTAYIVRWSAWHARKNTLPDSCGIILSVIERTWKGTVIIIVSSMFFRANQSANIMLCLCFKISRLHVSLFLFLFLDFSTLLLVIRTLYCATIIIIC